jgi:hypothetical protein
MICVAQNLSERGQPTQVPKLQVNLSQMWITVSSLLLSFVFIFGNSIRTIYESALFLFVVHPFDVGDQVLIAPNNDLCTVSPDFGPYTAMKAIS